MSEAVIRAMDGVGVEPGAFRRPFHGHHRLPADRGAAAAAGGVACAVRRAGRAGGCHAPGPRRRARKLARAGGMADIADQIVANALSAHTRENSPAAVAFVRESIMRQDPEVLCPHLRGAGQGERRRCAPDRGADAAGHRRRGRRQSAERRRRRWPTRSRAPCSSSLERAAIGLRSSSRASATRSSPNF